MKSSRLQGLTTIIHSKNFTLTMKQIAFITFVLLCGFGLSAQSEQKGWHGMPREGYHSFRLLDANSPALGSELELRGDKESEGAADQASPQNQNDSDKYDVMHRYSVAGPYNSETDRWHSYRVVLAVFR